MRVENLKKLHCGKKMTNYKSLPNNNTVACAIGCMLMLFVALCLTACKQNIKQLCKTSEQESLCDSMRHCFTTARQHQQAGRNDQAIVHFKRCLAIDSPDTITQLKMQPIAIDALLQMLNTYQAAAKNKECVEAFEQIHAHPTRVLKNYCWRDLHTILAYATLFSGQNQQEAEDLMLGSVKMPLKGLKEVPGDEKGKKRNLKAERLFRDYSYAAAICYSNPKRQEDVIRWCKQAIEVAKDCNETSGSQYVLSMLSSLYMKRGQVIDAINLSEEATDYAKEIGDTLSYINACNVLARIYHEIRMPELSNLAADKAIGLLEKCTTTNPMIAAQAYLIKSNAIYTLKYNDECLKWWNKANELAKKMPYSNGQGDVDFSYAAYLINGNKAENLPQAIKLLQKVISQVPALRAKAYHYLARAYELQGNDALCEEMLDSMYVKEHATDPPNYARRANDFAVAHYLRVNNPVMLARFTADQQDESKKLRSQAILQKVVREMVQNRMAQDNEEMQQAQKKEQLQLWIHTSLTALLAATVIFVITLLYKRRKKHNREKQRMIETLRTKEQELNNVTQKLEIVRSKADRQGELMKLAEKLNTETTAKKFEVLFEKYFPQFCSTIDEICPTLGRKERLTCLMLYIGLNSGQIAQSLDVTARTITIYRYRLRQKLKLGEETLDNFLLRMGKKD